jgi:hypothetical protein
VTTLHSVVVDIIRKFVFPKNQAPIGTFLSLHILKLPS